VIWCYTGYDTVVQSGIKICLEYLHMNATVSLRSNYHPMAVDCMLYSCLNVLQKQLYDAFITCIINFMQVSLMWNRHNLYLHYCTVIYSRTSLIRTSGDKPNRFELTEVRINRSTWKRMHSSLHIRYVMHVQMHTQYIHEHVQCALALYSVYIHYINIILVINCKVVMYDHM